MGGDVFGAAVLGIGTGLNPPRPHGRGLASTTGSNSVFVLKSTPPAWAGTVHRVLIVRIDQLKSTPPAWAGTLCSGLLCRLCVA